MNLRDLWRAYQTRGLSYTARLKHWDTHSPQVTAAKLPAVQPLRAQTDAHAKFKLLKRA